MAEKLIFYASRTIRRRSYGEARPLALLHPVPEPRDEAGVVVGVPDVLGDPPQVPEPAGAEVAAREAPPDQGLPVPPQVDMVEPEVAAEQPQEVGHAQALVAAAAPHGDGGGGGRGGRLGRPPVGRVAFSKFRLFSMK